MIRRLVPGDEALLRRLTARFKDRSPSVERAAAFLAREDIWVFAALDGDEPVGFAFGYELPRIDGDSALFFYEIEVAEKFRRRGIGRELIERLLGVCRERGVARMWVQTDEANVPAMRLYASAGGVRRVPDDVLWSWGPPYAG